MPRIFRSHYCHASQLSRKAMDAADTGNMASGAAAQEPHAEVLLF